MDWPLKKVMTQLVRLFSSKFCRRSLVIYLKLNIIFKSLIFVIIVIVEQTCHWNVTGDVTERAAQTFLGIILMNLKRRPFKSY